MTEIDRILDQLQRAYAGEAWHGPSVLESLEAVTAEMAARRPIPSAHTIWELTHHIGAWADIPRRRIASEVFEVTMEMNFPPALETTASAWQASLSRLAESQQKLLEAVKLFDESRLDLPVTKNGPTVYTLLHGVAQHHIYHAGQIMLLKK